MSHKETWNPVFGATVITILIKSIYCRISSPHHLPITASHLAWYHQITPSKIYIIPMYKRNLDSHPMKSGSLDSGWYIKFTPTHAKFQNPRKTISGGKVREADGEKIKHCKSGQRTELTLHSDRLLNNMSVMCYVWHR